MAKGRALAQLIMHMSHLTPVGWGYFACSVVLSGICYPSSKKMIPCFIRKQSKKCYPDFEWIVIPQYSMPLSLLVFLAMNSFLGYFCYQETSEDDIVFFCIMGIVLFIFALLPIFIKLFKLKCIMKNNKALFMSRFSLLGFYERIIIDADSIKIIPDKKGQNDDAYISFIYNGKYKCKLDKFLYSEEGWNAKMLAQCSEASKSQLSKYTSALLILMIVWSITGFLFAQRYVGLPVWGCLLVSLIFVTIVVMIERQIILAINPTKKLAVFRLFIAVIMAIVGSMIFDQTMFGKDIDKQLADNIEIQTASLTQKRVGVIDAKLNALQNEKSVLDNENAQMQEDVNNHPWVIQKSVTNSQQTVVVGGKMKIVNNPSVTTNQVANPKIETIKENNEKIKLLNDQEKEWSQKKLTVEEDTRAECKANVGFLEELETMFSIVMTRKVAGVFYLIFFALLMSLELFVVVSKMGDQECDYEMAIKGAQRVKVAQFAAAFGKVNDFKV